MSKKLYILLILIVSTEITFGKNKNRTKIIDTKKLNHSKNDSSNRSKRSDNEKSLWVRDKLVPNSNYDDRVVSDKNIVKMELVPQFWGSRGRRDSSSAEYYNQKEHPVTTADHKHNKCKLCYKYLPNLNDASYEYTKERRDESVSPFWGNRGRRNSEENYDADYSVPDPVVGNRDRKQENDPFWGTRGRRLDDSDKSRQRHLDNPFWISRGRRDDVEPFWGNRGRREEAEPLRSNRGRRQESEPFWGNRGRRNAIDLFDNRRSQNDLKESLLNAISTVENDIYNLSRFRRSKDMPPSSFWANRGRDSQLKYLFNGSRYKFQIPGFINREASHGFGENPTQSSTVHGDRIFAEQPRYILVERSSRSSSEDDPFFISRGKKKFHSFEIIEAARDRRGAIEELVKSVRNDPYYIARGKKDIDHTNIRNSTVLKEELVKAKELICATLDFLTLNKNEANKVKREVNDNDRDRRTILKKLAAQLQIDPYFVSRGKKNEDSDDSNDKLEDLISEISAKCH